MNRWSALLIRGEQWRVHHIAGDLHSAREVHLTPKEAHGQNLISTVGKYAGASPDPNEFVAAHSKQTKMEQEGVYLVSCWCGRTYVQLERRLIGKTTLSCGRAGCEEGGVPRCENCDKPLVVGQTPDDKLGRKPSQRWCSSRCRTQAYNKKAAQRARDTKEQMVPTKRPLTELEQYDREIERLSAEIKQLQGEGHVNIGE